MKKIIPLIFISLLLTGCWNYRELNSMAIVGSLGIDYDEENQMFDVSVQIFNAKKSSNGNSGGSETSQVTYYEQKAKTIHEALRNMLTESPKKLYIGHLDMVIFGEDIAKEHFVDSLDFLFRDSESRKDFQLFVTKGCDAKDVLKVLTPMITIPSASLHKTLAALSTYKGSASLVTYDEALAAIYGPGLELTLPTVEIVGSVESGKSVDNISDTTQDTKLVVGGMGIFKDDNLIGFMENDETVGYSFIMGEIKDSVISFPCDDEGNYGAIEINKASSEKEIKFKNGISGKIEVVGTASLSEMNCKINLNDEQNIKMIEDKANEQIVKLMEESLKIITKQYNSDIFGFGNQVYKKQYGTWQVIKDNWNQYFSNSDISINSKIEITNKGSITTSAKEG